MICSILRLGQIVLQSRTTDNSTIMLMQLCVMDKTSSWTAFLFAITYSTTTSTFVDPLSLAPFLSCCLIALDKNPGVRPIDR